MNCLSNFGGNLDNRVVLCTFFELDEGNIALMVVLNIWIRLSCIKTFVIIKRADPPNAIVLLIKVDLFFDYCIKFRIVRARNCFLAFWALSIIENHTGSVPSLLDLRFDTIKVHNVTAI